MGTNYCSLGVSPARLHRPSKFTHELISDFVLVYQEGVRGLYKGLTPPLLFTGLYQSVAFASFRLGMQLVPSNGSENPCDESTAPLLNLVLAGCFAGACTVVRRLLKISRSEHAFILWWFYI